MGKEGAVELGDAAVGPPPEPDFARLDDGVASALRAAVAVVEGEPSAAEARLALAQLYESNALIELAAEVYEQASTLDPEDPKARYHAARMWRELGDFERARAALDGALERAPDYAPAWRRSGEWWLEDGEFDAAERAFVRAEELAPELADGTLGRARTALARGDAMRAEELVRAVLAQHPEEGFAQHVLGMALRAEGRLDEAEVAFARAEGWIPRWSDPWEDEAQAELSGTNLRMREAKAALEAGEPALAHERLRPLIAAEPDDVTLQGMETAALVALGRFDEARTLLEAARERQPEHYRIELNLAIVHWKQKDLEGALEHLDRALLLHRDHPTALYVRAEVLSEKGAAAEAVAAYRAALAAGADANKVLSRLGRLEVGLGRFADAAETYGQAVRLRPDVAALHVFLAGTRAETGDLTGARAALERALELDPGHTWIAAVRDRIAELEARAAAASAISNDDEDTP